MLATFHATRANLADAPEAERRKPAAVYVAKSVAEAKWPQLSPRAALAKEERIQGLAYLPEALMDDLEARMAAKVLEVPL